MLITETPLYKNIKDMLTPEEQEELVNELVRCVNIDLNAEDLYEAMVWYEQPQGNQFWWDWYRRTLR